MGDILDDFIEIRKNVDAIKGGLEDTVNDIGGLDSTSGDDIRELWDPDAYAVHVGIRHGACLHETDPDSRCTACMDICPVDALRIEDGHLLISSRRCLGCGLCRPACPAAALVAGGIAATGLYDDIAACASTGEMAYVTCARAHGAAPPAGVKVLPCVGLLTAELWYALLTVCPNIAVFLPLDACTDCPVAGGEKAYSEAIARAEAWADVNVGYECDEASLVLDRKRSVERREFMEAIIGREVRGASKTGQLSRKALDIYKRVDTHRAATGAMRRRVDDLCDAGIAIPPLPEERLLFLVALQTDPVRARRVEVAVCTVRGDCEECGACRAACPTAALGEGGRPLTSLARCVGCGLCVEACPHGAIRQVTVTGDKLIEELAGD